MAEWPEGDVVANGIRIHYYRTGGSGPPLVLAHGATDDGLCWTRVARALQHDYDIIMPDARGHGLSEAPQGGYTPPDHAADLAGLIRALDLPRPVVCGHSMGGNTALYLAATYPDLPRCVILEDPPLRAVTVPPSDAERAERAERTRIERAEHAAQGREGLIAQGRARNPRWSVEEFEPWADAKLRVSLHFGASSAAPSYPDWHALLPSITCPTLLLTGDPEHGAIVTPAVAQEAARLLPALQVVSLAGAGHNIRREQFDAFIAALRAFLGAS